jgi:putative membrane protein
MTNSFKEFLQRWLINTAAVLVASYLLKGGIHYQRPVDLIAAALLLGILNAFLKPLLVRVGILFVILSLGLFILVINGVLLYLVGWLLRPGFEVASFKDAFWGGLVISIVTILLNVLTGTSGARVKVQRGNPRPPPPQNPPDGGGPIIDV